jgi:fluoride exporter
VRLLLIGLGGALGSILRYLLAGLVQTGGGGSAFPAGTLAVNLLGCLVIGVVAELSEARGFLDPNTRAMVVVGVIGGFTTFSTFANETVSAMRDNALPVAAGNVVLSVGLGLLAVWAGRALAHAVWG